MLALLVFAVLLLCGLLASMSERREWNDGVCRKNGMPWEYFYTDSQGGNGYCAGDETTWQSWGHDKLYTRLINP